MKTPFDFIKEAQDIVNQRGTDNGYDKGQERSAARIAAVFNALTDRDLTEREIWLLQICVKLVRNQGKGRDDNIVDLIGYAALLGESQHVPLAAEFHADTTPQQVEALAVSGEAALDRLAATPVVTHEEAKAAHEKAKAPEAGVARRALDAHTAEEKAAAAATAEVMTSLLTGVSLEVASGHHLDAWAKMLHTERLTFGVKGHHMRTEDDSALRARLMQIRKMQRASGERRTQRFG